MMRVEGGRRVAAHILVAEAALGRRLPAGAQVHHVNGQRDDNRGENLVICPDGAYHALLHRRERALDACGNANFRRCSFCKRYDDPANMQVAGSGQLRHADCYRQYQRNRYLTRVPHKELSQ